MAWKLLESMNGEILDEVASKQIRSRCVKSKAFVRVAVMLAGCH